MENEKKRKQRKGILISGLGIAALIIVLYIALFGYLNKTVTMPDVRGMSFEEAVGVISLELQKVGITDATFVKGWIDSHKPFVVDSQTPVAGTTIKRGDEVIVTLYIGEGWDVVK
ncbi:MAG: PASTA domain-containing protein [Lachnospiraceae bacterium]|nr:PASTA domain-containing protein [Lachnospiraceae bacterium]